MTDLSSQQRLISDAITALTDGAHIPDVPEEWQTVCRRGLIEAMRFALADHDTEGCPVANGECFATVRARQILEAQKAVTA